MKEFLVGLIFIFAALVLLGIGVLLYPFLLALALFLRLLVIFALGIFAIWLLGKFIILVWERMRKKE
ncbi:MAG: hypothetical protein JSW17_03080 [Candidatus Omnitrophota bacterium]|nr:MAG: hypothetical protein JSW17_03080 [Candidatus Omnitrophota bacterium]